MEFARRHIYGIIAGIALLILDIAFLKETRLFRPFIALSLLIITLQFWLDILRENKRQKEIELKFLEFIRALVQTVKSGIPIPKAIVEISKADYGALTYYVRKLANQLKLGIPLRNSLRTFAKDTKNKMILKSVAIVIEAEKSGGNIDEVLESVTTSIVQMRKIKDERRSDSYSQMVQGYFIFFVFIFIMLILQVYLLPQLEDLSGAVSIGLSSGYGGFNQMQEVQSAEIDFTNIFIALVLIQGFFAGLMVGRFAEGELKMGLKHSLILMISGYIIITLFAG